MSIPGQALLSLGKVLVSLGQVCSALAGVSTLTPGWDPSVAPGVKSPLQAFEPCPALAKKPVYCLI